MWKGREARGQARRCFLILCICSSIVFIGVCFVWSREDSLSPRMRAKIGYKDTLRRPVPVDVVAAHMCLTCVLPRQMDTNNASWPHDVLRCISAFDKGCYTRCVIWIAHQPGWYSQLLSPACSSRATTTDGLSGSVGTSVSPTKEFVMQTATTSQSLVY